MVYYIKAIDTDDIFVNCKSVNKKNNLNENLGDHIISYDDFLNEIFFHNEYNMIGNVIYDKGVLEIEYVDFNNDNYQEYKNTFKLVGSIEEANCMIRYIEFLDEIRDIVDYYNKTKEERLANIENKKQIVEYNKHLKDKAIDYSYSYVMDEEMKLLEKKETKELFDYITNNKEEVVRAVMKDTKGDKVADAFMFGLVGSAYSGLYALNNPHFGSQLMICGGTISIGGILATKIAKFEKIESKINQMMSELNSIYELNSDNKLIQNNILFEIANTLDYIKSHKDFDLESTLVRLDYIKEQYIEELKKEFQFGKEIKEDKYYHILAETQIDMYDITCQNEVDVDDVYINMAYDGIKNILSDTYEGYEKDISYIKYLLAKYQEANLRNDNNNYQDDFINKLVDLQIDVVYKRNLRDEDSISMVK